MSALNLTRCQGVGMEKQNMLTLRRRAVTSKNSLSVVAKCYFGGYMYEGFITVVASECLCKCEHASKLVCGCLDRSLVCKVCMILERLLLSDRSVAPLVLCH